MRQVLTRRLLVTNLSASAANVVRVPENSRLLRCDLIGDSLAFWFEALDAGAPQVARRYQVFDDDQDISDGRYWVATVVPAGDDLALHVYEVEDDVEHKLDVRPFGGGQSWAECSCGWRSSLQQSTAASEAAWEGHRDGGAS